MTTLTQDEATFRESLRANPLDRTTRLVYADWLDDRERYLDGALQRVLAQPADDGPRLAYADAAERAGQVERAEFIRVQVELARRGAKREAVLAGAEYVPEEGAVPVAGLQARERGLKNPDRSAWTESLNGWLAVEWAWFRRGFIASVTCSAADWLKHADEIRERQPIERVRLVTFPTYEWQITNLPPDWPLVDLATEQQRHIALDALEYRYPGIEFKLPR